MYVSDTILVLMERNVRNWCQGATLDYLTCWGKVNGELTIGADTCTLYLTTLVYNMQMIIHTQAFFFLIIRKNI